MALVDARWAATTTTLITLGAKPHRKSSGQCSVSRYSRWNATQMFDWSPDRLFDWSTGRFASKFDKRCVTVRLIDRWTVGLFDCLTDQLMEAGLSICRFVNYPNIQRWSPDPLFDWSTGRLFDWSTGRFASRFDRLCVTDRLIDRSTVGLFDWSINKSWSVDPSIRSPNHPRMIARSIVRLIDWTIREQIWSTVCNWSTDRPIDCWTVQLIS